ncbi:MAG: universal stress protein [Chloroflexota bacterium]
MAAAHLIRDLPLPAGSEVTALAVLTPRHTPSRAALLAALDGAHAILLKGDGVEARTGLLHGHPAEELTNYANVHRPDLMVVGAKGLRATLGILLGGVAQQVVEYAQWPVLVVRSPYAGLRRVLLVVDGSQHSQRAVDYFGRFPLPPNAEVRVMHVLPPLAQPDLALMGRAVGAEVIAPPSSYEAVQAAARQAEVEEREGQALFTETAEVLKASGIEARSTLVRGAAAAEIIEHVKTHEIDLVVAGSRGLSAVKGWWLGSVSRKLVHYAGCSVLIVKGAAEPLD